jgi:hypothetical protein
VLDPDEFPDLNLDRTACTLEQPARAVVRPAVT